MGGTLRGDKEALDNGKQYTIGGVTYAVRPPYGSFDARAMEAVLEMLESENIPSLKGNPEVQLNVLVGVCIPTTLALMLIPVGEKGRVRDVTTLAARFEWLVPTRQAIEIFVDILPLYWRHLGAINTDGVPLLPSACAELRAFQCITALAVEVGHDVGLRLRSH